MTFQGISEEENYNVIEYKTETKYGYDFMLIVLQYIIDTDFKTNLQRVAIVDDLLATGGTTEAAIKLIEKAEAEIVSLDFVIELTGLNGREKFKDFDVYSLVDYEF